MTDEGQLQNGEPGTPLARFRWIMSQISEREATLMELANWSRVSAKAGEGALFRAFDKLVARVARVAERDKEIERLGDGWNAANGRVIERDKEIERLQAVVRELHSREIQRWRERAAELVAEIDRD